MATTNILGLFTTPEQYQTQQTAQQQNAEQQRAFNFAQLSPRDQAVYGMFLGGQQLGRGVGRLLGGEDPQLRMISQRQQLMQSINPADPESLMAGIQRAAQAGDQELALSLTDFMNKQGSEMAQQQQRMAAASRERQQAIPADIAKSRELGVLTTALNALEATPQTPARDQQMAMLRTQISALERPEKVTPDMSNAMALADLANADRNSETWKTTYQQQLTRLTTKPENVKRSEFAQALVESGLEEGSPAFKEKMTAFAAKKLADKDEKDISFGADREAIAAEEFENKRYKDLTPTQKAKVNARLEREQGSKAERGATKFVMPGQKEPVDISKFRSALTTSLQPFTETLDAADSGMALMDRAINSSSFSAFTAARTELARMLQGGRLSNADVQNAGQNPQILENAKDFLSRTFTGTPSKETMTDMKNTMSLIKKVAKNKYNRELKAQRNIAKMSNISDEQINTLFEDIRRPEQQPAAAPAPGSGRVVDYNALPQQRKP